VLVALQSTVPALRCSPETGFSNLMLGVLALVVLHHAAAESRAWASAKALLTRPELTVLHQLGVLRRRRALVLLGILEDFDIYSSLNFPFLAFVCDAHVHGRWLRSWAPVPLMGQNFVRMLEYLRFWGVSGLLVAAVVLSALMSFFRLRFQECRRADLLHPQANVASGKQSQVFSADAPRLDGEQFFVLARWAETALMPSVAGLCEEMGEQRRWVYDAKDRTGGALAATKARQSLVFGWDTFDRVKSLELQNEEERIRVDTARKAFFLAVVMGRTLLGNTAMLWLQASFLQLAFDILGKEAMGKLLVAMAISALQICVRCSSTLARLGCMGALFAVINFAVLAWSCAKIYFAFHCVDHVWGIMTGCVEIRLPGSPG